MPVTILSTKEIVVKNNKNICCHRAYIITEENNKEKAKYRLLTNVLEENKTEKGIVKECTERVTCEQRLEMGREPARAMTLRLTHSWFEEKADVAGAKGEISKRQSHLSNGGS